MVAVELPEPHVVLYVAPPDVPQEDEEGRELAGADESQKSPVRQEPKVEHPELSVEVF